MPAATLSVVIVHYRVEGLLQKCLEHLHRGLSAVPDHEIFVVDNGPGQGGLETLRRNFPQIHWLFNARNEGFAKACNQGLRASQGRFCLLLNPDCAVSPATIAGLIRAMQSDAAIGLAGPLHHWPDGRVQKTCRRFPNAWNIACEAFFLDRLFPRSRWFNGWRMGDFAHDADREVHQLMGSCLLIRRELLDQIGLLDERFFVYFEDVDYCLRAAAAGWKNIFIADPALAVEHLGGGSSRLSPAKRQWLRYQSLCKWFSKNRPWPVAFAAKAFAALGLPPRLIAARLRSY